MQDIERCIDDLNHLVSDRNEEKIYQYLNSLPSEHKGEVFERFLKILYEGNGWLVRNVGGKGDGGADLLLSHPKQPDKINFIVQAKNWNHPLTFDDTKIELVKFEEKAKTLYDCSFFEIISLNGYVTDAKKLKRFNISLKSWKDIDQLIKRYDPNGNQEPLMDLYPHNQDTYDRIKELFKLNKKVCTVQATGTGKSYIIAKFLNDNINLKTALLAPSHYILNQFQKLFHYVLQNTELMTYASLLNYRNSKNKFEIIILDEFHRKGAEGWGAGVDRLLSDNVDAQILGVTATPIRYSDGNRDMSVEIFDGNVANVIDLQSAIARKLIKPPKYVSSLFSIQDEMKIIEDKIRKSKNDDEQKKDMLIEVNKQCVNWENTSGIPVVLKKHINDEISKMIIFCQHQEHMEDMELDVQKWFRKAFPNRKRVTYLVSSLEDERNENLETFKKSTDRSKFHLLFCIDMLNEGLHISDVDGVIFLRPTESPRIFYQQLGRCLQSGAKKNALVFDFVNNFRSIHSSNFISAIEEESEKENLLREEYGLDQTSINFEVLDETKDIQDVLDSIENRLDGSFEYGIRHLEVYIGVNGDSIVPGLYKTDDGFNLGYWVGNRRRDYHRGRLTTDQVKSLESLHAWVWDVNEYLWKTAITHLKTWIQVDGAESLSNNCVTSDGFKLGSWVSRQRVKYHKNYLSEDKIVTLESIKGWTWKSPLKENLWQDGVTHLSEYVGKNKNSDVPKRYICEDGFNLGVWVSTKRSDHKKGILSKEKINELESFDGWIWDVAENTWLKNYDRLLDFRREFNHLNIPQDYKSEDGFALGAWVSHQRANKKKSLLRDVYINKLESIEGWVWDGIEHNWQQAVNGLRDFYKERGHLRIPLDYKSNDGIRLGSWSSDRRIDYKRGKLTEERIEQLETLEGWAWSVTDRSFDDHLSDLMAYYKKHGSYQISRDYVSVNGLKIGQWISTIRSKQKKGKLNNNHTSKIEELENWDWDPLQTTWDKLYAELCTYLKINGHLLVPNRYKTDDGIPLGSWVGDQRKKYKNRTLKSDRIKKLESNPEWIWDPASHSFNQNLIGVKEYYAKFGNYIIKRDYLASNGYSVGKWISTMRSQYNKGKLTDDQIKAIESLDEWVWDPLAKQWKDGIIQLKKYLKKHNHSRVPIKYKTEDSFNLGLWVSVRRRDYKNAKISSERIIELESLEGWEWG